MAGEYLEQVDQQHRRGGHREDQADAVEPGHRGAARGRRHVPVDLGLLERAAEDHPAHQQHQRIGEHEADLLAGGAEAADEHVGAEVGVLAQADDGAQEDQPHEQPARDLLRDRNARIEGVAQHHVAEHQHHHRQQACRDRAFEQLAVAAQHRVHLRRRSSARRRFRPGRAGRPCTSASRGPGWWL